MIILFNGPPESGKDVACDFVRNKFGFNVVSFKTTLYNDVKRIFNLNDEDFEDFMGGYNDRDRKDVERPVYLGNMTRREAMIFSSEEVMKKIWGEGHYGSALAKTPLLPYSNYCASDCGFSAEIETLKDIYDGVIVCQIVREGKTFGNDSRSYIESDTIKEEFGDPLKNFSIDKFENVDNLDVYRIWNTGSLDDFFKNLSALIESLKNVYNF